jgi:RNA binding exosome subunit
VAGNNAVAVVSWLFVRRQAARTWLNRTLRELKANVRGELIQRGDERYEEARKLYNAMIDKQPLLIARCADAADVISALRLGREISSRPYEAAAITGLDWGAAMTGWYLTFP